MHTGTFKAELSQPLLSYEKWTENLSWWIHIQQLHLMDKRVNCDVWISEGVAPSKTSKCHRSYIPHLLTHAAIRCIHLITQLQHAPMSEGWNFVGWHKRTAVNNMCWAGVETSTVDKRLVHELDGVI